MSAETSGPAHADVDAGADVHEWRRGDRYRHPRGSTQSIVDDDRTTARQRPRGVFDRHLERPERPRPEQPEPRGEEAVEVAVHRGRVGDIDDDA
jgi:hypothetical protein